jgi:hypothetical protein
LLLLRSLLGIEPMGEHLLVDPAIPTTFGRIELLDIPFRGRHVDAFGRGRQLYAGEDGAQGKDGASSSPMHHRSERTSDAAQEILAAL